MPDARPKLAELLRDAAWAEVPRRVVAEYVPDASPREHPVKEALAGPNFLVAAILDGLSVLKSGPSGLEGLPGLPAAGEKLAAGYATGLAIPTIPVDAFNRVVWNDVDHPPNPYGTRDPLGDNESPMRTPLPVAAAVSGIVAGAGRATGQAFVSPLQVAMAAGSSAGKGWVAGMALGKVLGTLAGMPPEQQTRLQQLGLWGGLLTGAVRELFSG